jgi:large subunit ribosomal protein L17
MHRHGYKGRKFSLKKEPRELLFRNLATSVILHEKVKTTLPKAKEVQPLVEKMITLAKKDDLESKRALHSYLLDKQAVYKLQSEIVDLYRERNGGYTRITKLGYREGDSAKMAVIELIDVEKLDRTPKKEEKPKKAVKPAEKAEKKTAKPAKKTVKEKK